MKKLITYLKEGEGWGLLAMLVFSVLAVLLLWGNTYSSLELLPNIYPNIDISMFWIHLSFIVVGIAVIWLVYSLVVGVSTLLCCFFHLKLKKGTLGRTTSFAIIFLLLISMLLTLIAHILALFGEVIFQFYPLVVIIILSILLVMLIATALTEPREVKKKK